MTQIYTKTPESRPRPPIIPRSVSPFKLQRPSATESEVEPGARISEVLPRRRRQRPCRGTRCKGLMCVLGAGVARRRRRPGRRTTWNAMCRQTQTARLASMSEAAQRHGNNKATVMAKSFY